MTLRAESTRVTGRAVVFKERSTQRSTQTIDFNLSVICCKLSGINIITRLCKTNGFCVILDTPSQTIKQADIPIQRVLRMFYKFTAFN